MATLPEIGTKPGNSLAVAIGLGGLIVLAVALRLVPVVLVPSINWGDEVFQTVEPAHRVVFGYGLMTWEFEVGMRPWLLPGALAGVIAASRMIGDGPDYYLAAIAVVLGLLAAAPVVCCFLWGRRWFGLGGGLLAAFAVAVAPELVYFGARALNDTVAAHVLIVALYLAHPGTPVAEPRRAFAAGLLLGLVCLLRLQLAPAAALIVLWAPPRSWRARLPAMIGGGIVAVLAGGVLDWATLGYPFASVWRNFHYNFVLDVSSGFSVEPWYFYLLGELGVWTSAAPFVLVVVAIGARRLPLALVAALLIIAVHSAIPHKEYRFIYPAAVLLMALAALGLAHMAEWAAGWLRARGPWAARAAAVCTVIVAAWWGAVAYGAWSKGAIAGLRQRAHDELVAMAFVRTLPDICGVGLYGEEAWVRYGGYSHLHRPVPMYWPKDSGELAAASAGFDVLLHDDPAPPPELGYARLACFGGICVTRRAGRCETRPPPPTWYPEQLRGGAVAGRRFDPVPAPARQP